jgi:hypothetical protein
MPPNPQHAIAPGRIHCQISEEADGTRRYVLQVPEAAVPVAEACVEDLMSGRYQRQAQAEQDVVTAGVSALHRLLKRVEDNWHTGQARRIVAFLAGLYNGTDYPFDLTELRAVDRDIAADCLALSQEHPLLTCRELPPRRDLDHLRVWATILRRRYGRRS